MLKGGIAMDLTNYPELATYAKQVAEPTWFTEERLLALQASETLKMPSFQKIKYRHWPINLTKQLACEESKLEVPEEIDQAKATAVQVGQTTKLLNLSPALKEQGVIICDWQTALKEHADLIQAYFMKKAIKSTENRLTAEHVAKLTSGLLIYVPKNVVLTEPLVTYFVQDATTGADYVHHVLLIADSNSEVSYLENMLTVGQSESTANIIVEVIALDGSHVKFSSIDRLGQKTTAYLNRRGYLKRDAKIDWSLGMMSDGNIVGDYDSELVGTGSHAETKVIAISTGKQVQGIDTRVTNYGKNSIGHILQHGVILQNSNLIFNGIGHVMKGATGADAQQESRVLMLSRHARGDANPILLIDDNNVTAGHAASVGRVDEEQLYYLMSRGLPKPIAERLVIRGFLGPVLAAIPSRAIQIELENMIERKLVDGQRDE